ncbi:MAG: hypothetical protein NWE96_09105 [Candidatus Bathyarchaeota archaeon]|nr:hypothetical protein [Candidatus Bathyarchaeota archaeon]
MNSWHAVGYITLAFGFVFMANFLYLTAGRGHDPYSELNWVNAMILSWIVSVVTAIKGSNLTITAKSD